MKCDSPPWKKSFQKRKLFSTMAENILTAQGLRKSWGDKILFRDISFGLESRQKVGLLGTNGSGKSTLLKILGGRENDYEGAVTRRKDMTVHYLEQEAALMAKAAWRPDGPGLPEGLRVGDFIFSAFGKIGETLARYHALPSDAGEETAVLRSDLEKRIDADHGWALYREVVSMASQLEVDLSWILLPALSGGQLKKIQLVRALSGEPDLLLLDEPTNHLDEGTIRWLEDKLIRFGGTLALITHDRYFLERAVNHILELWNGSIQPYPGNYARYLEKKAELEANLARQDEKRLAFLRDEIDWIRRGPKARGTKAKARIDRYEEAKSKEGFSRAKSLELDLEGGARLGKTILEVEGLRKSYGDNLLFQGLDLSLLAGDRIGILGPNGCGKSTFLKILLGREKPDGGEVKVGVNTVMGYFDQKRAGLDPTKTVWQTLAGESEYVEFGGAKRPKRGFLEGFLFPPALQHTLVSKLSGGEQNRLQLAASLVSNPANLLLLDEPTNDLDINTLQVLEEALVQFPGCALIVSHDRYFLDRVATAMLVFSAGRARLLPGNYSAYLEVEEAAAAAPREAEKSAAPAKKRSALSYMEKKELEGMEGRIQAEEEALRAAEESLNAASARGDFAEVQKLDRAYHDARAAVDALYARWDRLEKKARGEEESA
jgi:ATP-binding cassette subfamily F protein uup